MSNNLEVKDKINKLVESKSWLELDGIVSEHYVQEDILAFRTRDNGDVGEEVPGSEDIEIANKMKELLFETFPNEISNISIETADKWVSLDVTVNP